MTQFEKLLEKFLKNPESVSLSELQKIILSQGFIEKDAKWSHIRYTKEDETQIILALHNNSVKNGYKKRICKQLFRNKEEA